MKHVYGDWDEVSTGDAYSTCRRCGVEVRIKNRETSKNFKVNGVWVSKTPPCEPLVIPPPVV